MPNYLDQEGLGYYDGKMKVYMSNAISSAVAATYKPGGSRTFEQLPSLVAEYVGFIYNITNDFTTTSDFVEGAGTFCKAGANVGIVNVGTNQSPVYKYDLFSAFVDLSNYATLDDLPTKTSDLTNDSGYASAFTGTTAQWNSLTDAQKAKYELVCLTDDLGDSDNVKDLMVNKAQATVIARQDEAATASRSYVVGDFVYRDNVLYKVTAAISTGDSFVVGTNISTTTVEAELSNKVDKVEGKGLSTNDYSDTEKEKVADNTSAIEAMINVTGSCNILPNNASTTTTHGHVTFTVNDDGSITANGSTTGIVKYVTLIQELSLKAGTYVVSSGRPNINYGLSVAINHVEIAVTVNDKGMTTFTLNSDSVVSVAAVVGLNTTVNNETIYPMLYDARLNPTGYVPYSMTNRELTERVSGFTHGDVIDTNQNNYMIANIWFGYVSSTSKIVLSLPLTLARDVSISNISVSISSNISVATPSGAAWCNNCTVEEKYLSVGGLTISITCDTNTSLVPTTPIIAGIHRCVITIS